MSIEGDRKDHRAARGFDTPRPEATSPDTCLNCGTELLGPHCHVCGQPVKGLVRPLGSVIHDFLDTVFEYDSRIWRTLAPLYFLPGRVTRDYLAGKRMRFVLPFRLFFVLTIVAFLTVQWTLNIDDSMLAFESNALTDAATVEELEAARERAIASIEQARTEIAQSEDRIRERSGLEVAERNMETTAQRRRAWLEQSEQALSEGREPPLEPTAPRLDLSAPEIWDRNTNPVDVAWLPAAANARINDWIERGVRNIERVEEDRDRIVRRLFSLLPPVIFVLVPVFALLLKLAHLFSGRLYMEHLIVALHAHSFLGLAVLMWFALTGLARLVQEGGVLQGTADTLATLAAIWIPVYLFVMQQRVYGNGWALTALKYFVLAITYAVVLAIASGIAVVISLVTA